MNPRGVSISILVSLLQFSTVVIGGAFAFIAWCKAIFKWSRGTRPGLYPGLSLLALTTAVLLDVGSGLACFAISWFVLIGSVILSWQKPTILKPLSTVLLIINTPLFVWLYLEVAGLAD